MILHDETMFPFLFLFIWMQMFVLYEVYTYFNECLQGKFLVKMVNVKLLLVIYTRRVSH